jgi:hypothetical protein
MESMVEQYADEAIKISQQAQESQAQAQQQAIQFQESLKQSTIQMQGKVATDVQQMKNQIQQMQIEITKSLEEQKIALEAEKIGSDNQTKIFGIKSERDTELAYLEEQRQEAQTETQLRIMELAQKDKADEQSAALEHKKIQTQKSKEKVK